MKELQNELFTGEGDDVSADILAEINRRENEEQARQDAAPRQPMRFDAITWPVGSVTAKDGKPKRNEGSPRQRALAAALIELASAGQLFRIGSGGAGVGTAIPGRKVSFIGPGDFGKAVEAVLEDSPGHLAALEKGNVLMDLIRNVEFVKSSAGKALWSEIPNLFKVAALMNRNKLSLDAAVSAAREMRDKADADADPEDEPEPEPPKQPLTPGSRKSKKKARAAGGEPAGQGIEEEQLRAAAPRKKRAPRPAGRPEPDKRREIAEVLLDTAQRDLWAARDLLLATRERGIWPHNEYSGLATELERENKRQHYAAGRAGKPPNLRLRSKLDKIMEHEPNLKLPEL